MKTFKKITYLLFILFTSTFAQKKIACIGDSITYGARIENREENSYPAQLQNILGSEYLVKNFGNSGSTLLKKGNKPYWNQKEFTAAKNFNPNIVIIKLGTNDTKPVNITHKEDFISNYIELIKTFKELSSKPKIYVCLPVPSFPGNKRIRNSVLINEIIPLTKKVIKQTDVKSIDLNTPFLNDAHLFPDTIHPNKDGAEKMAKIIAKHL